MEENNIQFIVETPGKVILHGEHSVVYGKTAVAASIDLKTTLKFTNNVDVVAPSVILDLPCLDCRQEFFLQDLNELLMQPLPLQAEKQLTSFNLSTPDILDFEALLEVARSFAHKKLSLSTVSQENAILSFLCLYIGMFSSVEIFVESFEMTVLSDLDIGAGMGSSTAFNISLAAGFLQYMRRRLLQHLSEPTIISKNGYKSFTFWTTDLTSLESRELELISRWGHLGDKIMHGNPSGIDNAVCTYGSIIEFRRGSGSPKISLIPNPKYLQILIVNTNIPRNTKKLVNQVAARRDRFMSVIDPILQAMDSIALSAAETLRHMSQISVDMELRENQTLEESVKKEITKLEELIDINQHLLESLGVSHHALEHICRIAKIEGLHGKLTGAGGGGYAFILLPYEGYEKKVAAIKMSLDRHNFPMQQVNLGGPGVTLTENLSLGDNYVPRGSIISEMIPDHKLSFSQIVHPSMLKNQSIPCEVKKSKEEENEEEMEEWPWPFDLREVVKNMLDDQTKKDLHCDEIAIPLKQLCAASIPEPLPKWMAEIDYFRKQVAPVWRNTVAKALSHNWKRPQKIKKYRKSMRKSTIDSSTNLLVDYAQPAGWPPYSAVPRGVSSILMKRKGEPVGRASEGSWPIVHVMSRQSRKNSAFVSSHEPEHLREMPYIMPKQSLRRSRLFPHERNPATWLIDKFPPYGDRKWTCDSDVEHDAQKQIEDVNLMHKMFLKQQKAGCEYLGNLMNQTCTGTRAQKYAKDDKNVKNSKYSISDSHFNNV